VPEIEASLPKYLQIAQYLRDQILRGDLGPGDEVPSERQLAADWNVSRPTTARSLDALRRQGLVEKRQGSGTYVRDQQVHRRARERYGRARQTGRIYAPDERAVIVSAGPADAPACAAEALGLGKGRQAVHRRRVTSNPSGPLEVSTSWFTPEVGRSAPKLSERNRLRQGTVAYVEECTGRSASYGEDRVCARLATEEELRALALEAPAAVLVVRHVVYDLQDQALEFVEAVYPPGSWAFEQGYPIG
jgi:GntR family transcriptional regulator